MRPLVSLRSPVGITRASLFSSSTTALSTLWPPAADPSRHAAVPPERRRRSPLTQPAKTASHALRATPHGVCDPVHVAALRAGTTGEPFARWATHLREW